MTKIVTTISDVKAYVNQWRQAGETVGFVPTMGYLHEGHRSLMQQAGQENSKVIVSIFVNPMQFAPNEDLATYPRDLERDQQVCQQAGVDLIFHPQPEEMYSNTFATFVYMNGLSDTLCGSKRAGHFRGVCTVVTKLFNIVEPHRAYFGQKDAQQLAIIRQMVHDLNMNVDVVGCPIIREEDGLAKSSRNSYLNSEERQAALCLFRAIQAGQALVAQGERNSTKIEDVMKHIIMQEPLANIDYLSIVSMKTLQSVNQIDDAILCALAVYIGKTRLIDNFIFEASE